jgi:hypothetical protein
MLLNETMILWILLHYLFMITFGNQIAAVKKDDIIDISEGRESMRNDKAGYITKPV